MIRSRKLPAKPLAAPSDRKLRPTHEKREKGITGQVPVTNSLAHVQVLLMRCSSLTPGSLIKQVSSVSRREGKETLLLFGLHVEPVKLSRSPVPVQQKGTRKTDAAAEI